MRSQLVRAVVLGSFVAWGLMSASAQAACPAILAKLAPGQYDLCQISERYQTARATLLASGYSDPDRIAEVIAPRFISYPDWEARKTKSKINYNPWLVYCPAPETWASWERGNQQIRAEAKRDLEAGSLSPISVDWIVALWRLTMSDLQSQAGEFRDKPGMSCSSKQGKDSPLTSDQVEHITNLTFRKIVQAPVGGSIITWESKSCGLFGVFGDKKCGVIRYPDGVEVVPQLTALVNEYNAWASTGAAGFNTATMLSAIARLQQWIISIHPFDNGNGRTSRLLMDRLFFALGLPAPLLWEMSSDLYSTHAEWGDALYEGLLTSLRQLERCAANPSALGCSEVPASAPSSIPDVCLQE